MSSARSTAAESASLPAPCRRVVLLHGVWNARAWLLPLAARLRRRGLAVSCFGYASILGGPEPAARRLAEHVQRFQADALVAHSLGGLVALQALAATPGLPVRRLVCLGSPLGGSTVARTLARRARFLLGRSAPLLCAGVGGCHGAVEVGQVAGSVPRGAGRWLGIGADSDGTVALAETRIDGLADHCVVAASHAGLLVSADAEERVAGFLRTGRFCVTPRSGGGIR